MARTKGSIGWKKQQAYLHEKFPDQGWMEETDKNMIKEHYKGVQGAMEGWTIGIDLAAPGGDKTGRGE